MTKNSRLSVGVVGCGHWGQHIVRDLTSLGCEVVAVARSAESRRRAGENGAKTTVRSIDELPDVDGLVVATPTSTHATVVEELLDLEVPVFVEKPLTEDPASAQSIAERAGDRVFVMDKWRYHPGVERLRDIARSGEIGPVVGLRALRVSWGLVHEDSNCVYHLAPHDLAIGLEVLGHLPRPRSSTIERIAGKPVGMVALLGDDPWMIVDVSIRSPERVRKIHLHCTEGVATLRDGYADHVEIFRGRVDVPGPSADVERLPISTEMPLLRELRAFVEYLGGGPPPRSSASEGAAIVAAIATLLDPSRTGAATG